MIGSPAEGLPQPPVVLVPLVLRPTLIDPRRDIMARLLERFSGKLDQLQQSWTVEVWPQSLLLRGDFELLLLAYIRLGHFVIRNGIHGGMVTLEFIQRGRAAECSMSYFTATEDLNRFYPCAACSIDVCHRKQHPDTRLDLCVVRYVVEAHGGWIWSDIGCQDLTRIAFTLPEQATSHGN